MNLLALDTSTPRAAVALAVGPALHVGDPEATDGGRHGRQLLPRVKALLRAAGLRPGDLDALAVGLGPGSYTGLRVGLTAAKTLAFALGKPLIGLDSFAAIARNAPGDAESILGVADAQRGDAYLTEFAPAGSGLPPVALGPIRLVSLAEWAPTLPPGAWVLGPGLDRLRVDWPAHARLGGLDRGHPAPGHLIALGLEGFRAGQFADPATLEPRYIRRSAAEDQWATNRPGPR